MGNSRIDQLITQLENFLECWKQINFYISMARAKKFTLEDEGQFLEIKSIIAQELELILAAIECEATNKEEIHSLLSNAPSIRFLSELNETSLRGLENQWHKVFITWQSILGQLKVQQQRTQSTSFWKSLINRNKPAG
jgi:hypothetical protein